MVEIKTRESAGESIYVGEGLAAAALHIDNLNLNCTTTSLLGRFRVHCYCCLLAYG